ncbi:MAG: GntR family transcriptional regulator [Acidobacteria bacterium]|nr:GntR family transcriptional regulator [Acidobacteriota bacterium]
MLNVDPRDALPIWRQIEQGLRDLIRLRRLEPGDVIPSVREFARSQRINPATVAKAYRSLTDAGYLEIRRGEGTFVAAEAPSLDSRSRRELLRSEAARLIDIATGLGAGPEDLSVVLERLWSERAAHSASPKEKQHA